MDLAALAAIAGGANADAVACAAREADWRLAFAVAKSKGTQLRFEEALFL